MKQVWLSSIAFADAASVSRRAATKALARAGAGHSWNGMHLQVREAASVGGRSGVRYEVALSSLSTELQERFSARSLPTLPLFDAPPVERVVEGWDSRAEPLLDTLRPALLPHLTGAERAAEVDKIVADGMPRTTALRHIRNVQRHGTAGLLRKRPADAGKPRVAVSRRFDKAFAAAGHPAELLPQLSAFCDGQIKGLWAGRAARAGGDAIQHLASVTLWEECERLGAPMARADCEVGMHRVKKHSRYKVVSLKRYDAKAFQNSEPHGARDWTGHAPMECVVADVKHLDVSVRRDDTGKVAWPKMIGFMDMGTQRLFAYLVLCPERRSITQELVADAFIAMSNAEAWGLPQQLYLDNGSEFRVLDKAAPILARLNAVPGREIVRALPYRASSKPIEGLFGRLDRRAFSLLPGYAGSDRMNKKTQNVGREPEAFDGGWDEFRAIVTDLITNYHNRHIKGQWNATPNELLKKWHDEHDWRPIYPAKWSLELSFCEYKSARLSKEGVRFRGERYWHPVLGALPTGSDLELIIPHVKPHAPIVVIGDHEPVRLTVRQPVAANDHDAPALLSKVRASYRRGIANMEADVPTVDPIAIERREAARADAPHVAGRRRTLSAPATVHALPAPEPQLPDLSDDERARRKRERDDRITANLLREQARART